MVKQIDHTFRYMRVGKAKPETAGWADKAAEIQIFGPLRSCCVLHALSLRHSFKFRWPSTDTLNGPRSGIGRAQSHGQCSDLS